MSGIEASVAKKKLDRSRERPAKIAITLERWLAKYLWRVQVIVDLVAHGWIHVHVFS